MKKILIALTAVFLAVIAALPVIVGAVMDSNAPVGYSPMQSVKLDISQNPKLSYLEKLHLFSYTQAVDIQENQASMTEEEAISAAISAMQPYVDAGIFEWFEPDHHSAVPKLAVDTKDTSRYVVHWSVTFIHKKDPTQNLMLDIDDESGKILGIRYDRYTSFSMDGVWERNQAIMDAFTAIYFSQLGLTEEAAQVEYQYLERDGGVSCAQYHFPELQIDFYVDGTGGFYVVFWN